MESTEFFSVLFIGSCVAGLIGATSGLGGGIILMPLMVLFFQVDTLLAIGTSLLGVIVTSLGSSIQFLRKDFVDIRTTALLETATVPGAIIGAILATIIHEGILLVIFGIILIISVIQTKVKAKDDLQENYPRHKGWGWIMMLFAGIFSGLLGIGSGALKVLAMDRVMRIPFRTSTATSSFMIGVTAAASASAFYHMGYIEPKIAMPLIPGVLLGAFGGAKLVSILRLSMLRWVFTVVIVLLSIEMIIEGVERMLA